VSSPRAITRFAPAPTGLLHLGHVVNAIYVWGLGRRLDARVILRVEDHDAQRSRPEFERALLDDLDWLGFEPDLFPTTTFRAGPCQSRQSDRLAVYAAQAARLVNRGMVYACTCSRRTLGPVHDCPTLGAPLTADVAWRLRLPVDRAVRFEDQLTGSQTCLLARDEADVVIRDRHGNWTYQFAVSVDDYLQGVTLVIRGRDLHDSTAVQILIGEMCGRVMPAEFAHHELVMASPTQKLSKSSGHTGIAALRAAGWSPSRVIGEAASRVGLAPEGSQVEAGAVERLFKRPGLLGSPVLS